jgi:hypothetical protein
MKRKTWFLFIAVVGIACLYSCTKDHTAIPVAVNCTGIVDSVNTYNKNISNIMSNYCAYAPCHGGGVAQGGVDLSSYSSTVTAFQSQNVICAVTSTTCGGIRMPDGIRPLDSVTILQMECWQANGFPQ